MVSAPGSGDAEHALGVPMAVLRCDFYDWITHRRSDQPARWVTYQSSRTSGVARYYRGTQRPPGARPTMKRVS